MDKDLIYREDVRKEIKLSRYRICADGVFVNEDDLIDNINAIPAVEQPMSAVEYEIALQALRKWCWGRLCFNCRYHDPCGKVLDETAEYKVDFVKKWVKDQRGEN